MYYISFTRGKDFPISKLKRYSNDDVGKKRVTIKLGVPHWCPYWCTLVLRFLDKVNIFFQCIAYFLLILHSNMHWLSYTQCKMCINRI